MIKTERYCVPILACILTANILAEPVCQKTMGEMICGAGDVIAINASGAFRANGTHVKKKALVKGQAIFKNSEINDLKIYGEVILQDTVVLGNTKIYGFLSSRKVKFHKPVAIAGNYMSAEASSFNDIIIEGNDQTVKISLFDKTIVNGSIIFKGNPGVVALGAQSKVMGKVVNGKII